MLVSLTIMIYQYQIKGKHKNDMDWNNEEEIHIYTHNDKYQYHMAANCMYNHLLVSSWLSNSISSFFFL